MISEALFSSATDNWATPQAFFDSIRAEFGEFDLDPCADEMNKKAPVYFTREQDGLAQDWSSYKKVWCNPPYGRGIGKWIAKAIENVRGGGSYQFYGSPLEQIRRIFMTCYIKRQMSSSGLSVAVGSSETVKIVHLSRLCWQ